MSDGTAESSGPSSPVRTGGDWLSRVFIDVLSDPNTLAPGRAWPASDHKPLAGVPIAVKNNIAVAGLATRAGSDALDDEPADEDAPVIASLKASGAVIAGTTNMNELAYGFTGKNETFGDVPNPWFNDRMSGGSSSGSAAAVAMGFVPVALGTDTNGSIRVPAALCGIWALRPTTGRVSPDAIVPLAPTLDTAGPLATTVGHLTAAARAIDPLLSATAEDVPLAAATIGGFPNDWVQPEVAAAVERVALHMEARKQIVVPLAEAGRGAAQMITAVEGAATHIDLLRYRSERIGALTRHRLLAGALVPGHYYARAQHIRARMRHHLLSAMADIDLIIAPATPCLPPNRADELVRFDDQEEGVNAALGRCTSPFSLVGFPSLVAPVTDVCELPVGVQIIAQPGRDHILLQVASQLEEAGICRARVHG